MDDFAVRRTWPPTGNDLRQCSPTQNPNLKPFKISFGRVLPQIQQLFSRISGGENVDEGHFRLVAMSALNAAKSCIRTYSGVPAEYLHDRRGALEWRLLNSLTLADHAVGPITAIYFVLKPVLYYQHKRLKFSSRLR